jgi:hypothetical protein
MCLGGGRGVQPAALQCRVALPVWTALPSSHIINYAPRPHPRAAQVRGYSFPHSVSTLTSLFHWLVVRLDALSVSTHQQLLLTCPCLALPAYAVPQGALVVTGQPQHLSVDL